MRKKQWIIVLALCTVGAVWWGMSLYAHSDRSEAVPELINVSYDPTREFYEEYNREFEKYYKDKTGREVIVRQSHGSSGNQARAVVEGFDADVVTLATAQDVNLLQRVHLLPTDWEKSLPRYSSPYTSTIVFLVRQGNPLRIHDWNDLLKQGTRIIAPDPKSSGGACWIFLAAYAYGGGRQWDDKAGEDFVAELYKRVAVMDAGTRGATTTFVENQQGDVLLAWENEALQVLKNHPKEYEIIVPSVSIVAEPSVAVITELAKKRHTYDVAQDYLAHLYEPDSQRMIARYGFRPTDSTVMKEFQKQYPSPQRMVTIRDFGGWAVVYEKFFADGALFDSIRNT